MMACVRRLGAVEPLSVAIVGVGALLLAFPVILAIGRGLLNSGYADLAVYQGAVEVWAAGASPYGRAYVDDLLFVYPPSALVVLAPLALVSTEVGGVLLVLVGSGLTVGLVRLCHPVLPPRWLLAVTAGYLMMEPWASTFANGQISVVLTALVAVAALRAPRSSGWLIGVAAAVKVYPGAYAFIDVVRGRRTSLRGLLLAPAALLALAVVGQPGLMADWLDQQLTLGTQPVRVEDRAVNQSWRGLLDMRWGADELPWLGVAVALVVLACLAAVMAVRQDDTRAALAAISLGVVLAAPVAWTHYWVFLPVLAATVSTRRTATEVCHAAAVTTLLASAALAIPFRVEAWPWHYAFVLLGTLSLVTLALTLRDRGRRGAAPVAARTT
jgi:alpha-1,2-mannosyltransferase